MSTGVRPLTNSNLQKALVGLENGRSVAAESGEGLMATNSSRRLGARMSAAAPVRSAKPSEKLRSSSTLTADLPSFRDEARDDLADRDRDGIATPKLRTKDGVGQEGGDADAHWVGFAIRALRSEAGIHRAHHTVGRN